MPVQQNSFTHLRVLLVLTDRGSGMYEIVILSIEHRNTSGICVRK
jgi:hypothetical protein